MFGIQFSLSWNAGVALNSFFVAALAFAASSAAQTEEPRSLELDDGASLSYTLRSHPPGAHLLAPSTELGPTSALNAAKLLNLHLSTGDIEEAALLSNAPRRRFEVLRDYRESVGEEEFKRVFAQYFFPENRLLAEVAIGKHRLLLWQLSPDPRSGAAAIVAGQFFVEVEGRYLMNDVPGEERSQLARILQAWRDGRIRN